MVITNSDAFRCTICLITRIYKNCKWHGKLDNNMWFQIYTLIYCSTIGIPDEKGYRSLCWRLLLNYLPCDRNKWEGQLDHHRKLYQQWLGN